MENYVAGLNSTPAQYISFEFDPWLNASPWWHWRSPLALALKSSLTFQKISFLENPWFSLGQYQLDQVESFRMTHFHLMLRFVLF